MVDENADNARFAQEGDGGIEPLLAIERGHAEPATVAVYQIVDERVAKRLIHRAKPGTRHLEYELRVEFPVSDMVDCEDDRAAVGKIRFYAVEVLDGDNFENLFLRDCRHFKCADRVGTESSEVAESEISELAGRFFPLERGPEVFPGKPAVAWKDHPEKCSHRLAK